MVLEYLVEADGDVERRGLRGLVLEREVAEQCPRRDRDLAHAAFHEVAGGDRLGGDEEVHPGLERGDLRQHPTQPLEVGGVFALDGADLGDGEAHHGSEGR